MIFKRKSKNKKVRSGKKMNRKEAIKKTGVYAATAATTMFLLGSPNKAAADPSTPPPWPTQEPLSEPTTARPNRDNKSD